MANAKQQVEVQLIRPMQLENGSSVREFVGELTACDDPTITVKLEDGEHTFPKKDAAYIRLYEEIDWKAAKI